MAMKEQAIVLVIFMSMSILRLSAQIAFTLPDTVCAFEPVDISNLSPAAQSYSWSFCSGNTSYEPKGQNLGNIGQLNGPAFIDIVGSPAEGWYGLITNHTDGTLTRLSWGSKLNNPPVADNLGNFGGQIPVHVQGTDIIKESGNYYALIVGGQAAESSLLRLDFGASLQNDPAVTNLGNLGVLDYPVDIAVGQEGSRWIAIVSNYESHEIVRLDFGNSLINIPVADVLPVGDVGRPCGVTLKKEGTNWFAFIPDFGEHTLLRLSFGASLLSEPVVSVIESADFAYPFDVFFIDDCQKKQGFLLNKYDDVVRFSFSSYSESPDIEPIGRTGGINNPHGISPVLRQGDSLFVFINNSGNSTLTRWTFDVCSDASLLFSDDREPEPFYYLQGGNYNVRLVLNADQPGEEALCKDIVVLPPPLVDLGPDATICPQDPLGLDVGTGYESVVWHDGSTETFYTADTAGVFHVTVEAANGCKSGDTIQIGVFPNTLDLGNDTVVESDIPLTLDAGPGYQTYRWSNRSTERYTNVYRQGIYEVEVTDNNGCRLRDQIHVDYRLLLRNFITPNGDGFNDYWEIPLLAYFPYADIRIYTADGKLITAYKGSDSGWNGFFGGKPVEDDSYWYIIDLHDEHPPYKGYLVVKK